MKIIYQSYDGKIFDTKKACLDYEDSVNRQDLNGILYGMFTLDTTGAPSSLIDKGIITLNCTNDDINYIITNCNIVYFPDFTSKRAFGEYCDAHGLDGNYENFSTGWNIYNEDVNDYVPLTNANCLKESWRDDSIFERITNHADNIHLRYGGGE